MSDFTLDKSGFIASECLAQTDPTQRCTCYLHGETRWPDLSPFEQGYMEAQAKDLKARLIAQDRIELAAVVRFCNWAPETLAAIRKDCAAYQQAHEALLALSRHPDPARAGRIYWIARNQPDSNIYAPLTITLGDDGRVYLREAV